MTTPGQSKLIHALSSPKSLVGDPCNGIMAADDCLSASAVYSLRRRITARHKAWRARPACPPGFLADALARRTSAKKRGGGPSFGGLRELPQDSHRRPSKSEGALRNACLSTYECATRGKILLLVLAFLLVCGKVGFAEEMVERIDGHVVRVDPEKRIIVIGFEHPVTEEKIEKEIFIQKDAGFKEFKKLNDLKKDDLVSIDYREEGSYANAVYVIRVPLRKAYVSTKELAGALTHIKPEK